MAFAADFAHKFGSYDYTAVPGLLIEEQDDPLESKERVAETPGRDGGHTEGGLVGPLHFTVAGRLKGSDRADLLAKWLAFRAAHRRGEVQRFYLHSDLYRNAECQSITKATFAGQARNWLRFAVEFYCADPFTYADSLSEQDGLQGGGVITIVGEVEALPALTLTVSAVSTGAQIVVTNTTTGQAFTLAPTDAATYVIDSLAESVTKDGVDADGELTGQFLQLNPGDNAITVAVSAATISGLSAAWQERYL